MKKLGPFVARRVARRIAGSPRTDPRTDPRTEQRSDARDGIAAAYAAQRSDVQVGGVGVVLRLLADDNDGSRHQRFILRLADGQTVLVAHNIDLAPRLSPIARGDTVSFYGEYEWNQNGGVIHWTHHDPAGRHVAGWLELEGRRVQ